MLPQKQLISDAGNGDCFRACMCSMLDLPNTNKLPNVHDPEWFLKWQRFFKRFGMRIEFDHKKIWREGFWIASVPSLNYKNVWHAIVMKDTKVYFDPSPKLRYKKGRDLLSESKLVRMGYWIEIDDISKIKKLEKYRSILK